MPELRELAFRIACELRADEPEPLCVELWHQSPDTAAYLVGAVIDECREAGIRLEKVRVDRYVAVAMHAPPGQRTWIRDDVHLEIDDVLLQVAEFHRSHD
jgi:hypothetical protein